MQLESVLQLKQELKQWLQQQPANRFVSPRHLFGLGIVPVSANDFKLAVRVLNPDYMNSDWVNTITHQAKGEIDIRYTGPVVKHSRPWQRRRSRPLMLGSSIAHYDITVGTLGAFVRSRQDGSIKVLSNNHVLAHENDAHAGDAILQPGRFDNGKAPRDVVAKLDTFVPLDTTQDNLMDCAMASLDASVAFEPGLIQGVGHLSGLGQLTYQSDLIVGKVGRTTGHTIGQVTAFDVDITITYDIGDVYFVNQLEVEGQGPKAFSNVGDSGALVFTEPDMAAVGLLFAGTDYGGSNGKGLAYANSLARVLDQLGVDLVV